MNICYWFSFLGITSEVDLICQVDGKLLVTEADINGSNRGLNILSWLQCVIPAFKNDFFEEYSGTGAMLRFSIGRLLRGTSVLPWKRLDNFQCA
jgi:hypothetical protein